MGICRPILKAAAASAIAMAVMAVPAVANEGPPMPDSAAYVPSPDMRDRWIAECTDRLSEGYRHERREERTRQRDRARSRCESYHDDYYAYYRSHQANAVQPSYYRPMRAQTEGCDPSPDCRRGCAETVEYEYVDVPVQRRYTPLRRPSKRVKVVPDKRIRVY